MKKSNLPILLFAFLAACQAQTGNNQAAPIVTSTPVIEASATAPIAPPPETIVAPTLAPNPTATAQTRLPPERWQEWPIIPVATERAIEIYRLGQTLGLDGHAFSKVGDCQSIKAAFMGYFDIPERFSLGNDYAYLQQTVDNFAGHFNTDGQAVRGGFNAAAVLSPLWADPKACLPGENPLECELRITKPIIVIVSLEVWWDGRTPQQYEILMRKILDTIIAHGAVPILATKADNVEGDNSLNLTTARLAFEYDLPLWNFWAAVQPLQAHGMDTKRNDGFHISTDAWSTRSFTGLEALDSVWRGLLRASHATVIPMSATITAAPEALATVENKTPSTTLKTGAASLNIPGQIVFGLDQREGEGYAYLGIYLFDPRTEQTRQVFGSGVQFQSASADGKTLLVNKGSTLYRTSVDGSNPLKLTDSFYSMGKVDAVWLSNGEIAAILTKSGGTVISILSSEDGELVSELPVSGQAPFEIYPTSDKSHIYWESGYCGAPGVCQANGTWVTSPDGKINQSLPGMTGPTLAPDGKILVGGELDAATQNTLVFAESDGSKPRSYPLPGNLLVDYAWSPEGDGLAAIVALRSDYSGKVSGNRNFLVDPRTLAISEYEPSTLLNPRILWAPDGKSLFWIGTKPSGNGFAISGSLVDRASKQVIDLGNAFELSSSDYLAVTNSDWLPLP